MQKKTVVKHKFKTYVVSFFAVSLLITSFFFIYSSLNIKTSLDVPVLTYSQKSDLDYKVYLKKNNYFKEKYLTKNKQYIASIIDYIDVSYNYTFSSSKDVNLTYKYKIVAKINARYKVDTNNTKQVWQNEYVLLDEKELEINNDNTFTISENVKIDYDKYNDIISNFKKDYMLAVTSDLTVSLLVDIDGEYIPAEKVFNENADINLTIPLSEQTINIKMDYKNLDNNQIVNVEKLSRFSNLPFFAVGVISSIISIVIIISMIRNVLNEDKKQSEYIKRLKKILHDYGDMIVEVKKPPQIQKNKASEVMNFSELINAQIEVKSPIVFSEVSKNELGLFVLFDKENAYYYLLKSEEKDKEKA